MKEKEVCDTLDYRGFHIDFYNDDYGQQVYTNWEGKELGFGTYNFNYKEDMMYLIDDKLDIITRFPELQNESIYGAKLEWFTERNKRDIKLVYRSALVKIYRSPENQDLEESALFADRCIEDAKQELRSIIRPIKG